MVEHVENKTNVIKPTTKVLNVKEMKKVKEEIGIMHYLFHLNSI